MAYYAHTQEEFDSYKQKIEDLCEVQHTLPSWPMQFVGSMKSKLAQYGREIALTKAQIEKLGDIHRVYCEDDDTQQDTFDRFNGRRR